ncbi:hypothetical protein HPB50_024899 [Hyalomma asiaticum]|uniref:Uncharacterized protein n=1 Tax=Hyalomma asiaticum TaxID=266040 RepID=A0ACB7TQP8_HYAAI|nr:hypothetical protein HPB50_024899 [Hyalomma asiaticum]
MYCRHSGSVVLFRGSPFHLVYRAIRPSRRLYGTRSSTAYQSSPLLQRSFHVHPRTFPEHALPTDRTTARQRERMDTAWAEYGVFAILMVANFALGLYFSFRRRSLKSTADEVFLGSRSLHSVPLAVSALASIMSSIGIVGVSAHVYAYGTHMFWNQVLAPINALIAAHVVVPVLYRLRVTSVFEGGLRGVVWTDCAQAGIVLLAPATIMIKIAYDAHMKNLNLRQFSDFPIKTFMFETSFDFTKDENVWACLIGLSTMYVYRGMADQMIVQRFLASRNLKQAQRTAIVGTGLVLVYYAVASSLGVALIYWFRDCDPLLTGAISSYDQIIMVFYNSATGPFVGLFFLALVFPWANGFVCQPTACLMKNTAYIVPPEEDSATAV